MNRPDIITFGCRLNAFESEVMAEHAAGAGLAGAIIVNTCAVTSEAVRQARQAIRKARRERPQARIIVTGCAAQIEPERFAAMPEVDHVIGNAEKMSAATFGALAGADAARVLVNDIQSVRETAGHMVEGLGSRVRAYVQIQNGCDHRCTFCIIPFGRGPSRSVPAGEVVSQIRKLVENGHREVVLTGVDMTAWGADLPGAMKLGTLVRAILRHVPELERLRISSIDSVEADDDLIRAVAEEERLMPHLHLSLQHGHDMILKRMKRRHSRADSVEFCERLRALRPDIAFGADLIAGFPTETDDMFAASLSIVDDCGLDFLHVFPYSARPGTPAARMPQLDGNLIKERAARLRAKGGAALRAHLAREVGHRRPVLMETGRIGRTPQFSQVELNADGRPGEVVLAQLTGHDGERLHATASA